MAKKNEDEEAPKPKKSKLKIVMLLIILLMLGAGGAGVYWWFQLRSPADSIPHGATNGTATSTEQSAEQTESNAQTTNPNPAGTTATNATTTSSAEGTGGTQQTVVNLVNVPTVTVNLADKEPIRYLRLGLDVELTTTDAAQRLKHQIAKVRDAIIITLSSKTYSELATTSGKLNIKNEISTRLNQIIGSPRVVQIYFTEFVVQ